MSNAVTPNDTREKTRSRSTVSEPVDSHTEHASPPKDHRFWAVILATCVSLFLSALDITALSTALPTIVRELNSSEFTWVGSSYALTSTAFIPWMGGLSYIFGRRPLMLASLGFFAVGSAICGAAPNMTTMLIGRSVQGVGGGGILSLAEIIITDLVPLLERGLYYGVFGAVWALASVISPIIAGALAQSNWRWFFYMNLPISAIAMALVALFMNVKRPEGTFREKFAKIDWIGNAVFIAATSSVIYGLTVAGSKYSWSSYRSILPLVLGVVGTLLAIYIEKRWIKYPTIPFSIFTNHTSVLGFLQVFIHAVAILCVVYYLPVFYQAVEGHGPIRSGIDILPMSFSIAPVAIICGASITASGRYRFQNILGWVFIVLGQGLLILMKFDSNKGITLGLSVVGGIGFGIEYSAMNYPIIAPLDAKSMGLGMAFMAYVRSAGQVFGITVGSTILTNQLPKRLPEAFISELASRGVAAGELAFSSIALVAPLSEPLRSQVREAFALSIRTIWISMTAFTVIGLVASLCSKTYSLNTPMDDDWGLDRKEKTLDEENDASVEKRSSAT